MILLSFKVGAQEGLLIRKGDDTFENHFNSEVGESCARLMLGSTVGEEYNSLLEGLKGIEIDVFSVDSTIDGEIESLLRKELKELLSSSLAFSVDDIVVGVKRVVAIGVEAICSI